MTESAEMPDREDDDRNGDDADEASSAGRRSEKAPVAPRVVAGGGFFDIYKRSQGGKVRWGTGLCAFLLLFWGVVFLYEKLNAMEPSTMRQVLQYGLTGGILVAGGLILYYLLARAPRVVDFLVGTEGEMKKVHWSTRKEVIGSTKVVIFMLLLLAVTLFVVDIGLMLFFTEIGVLRVGKNLLSTMFGKSG